MCLRVAQLSNSGMSQSKKLVELADVNEKLRRTRAALEQAERLVFEQRQEGASCIGAGETIEGGGEGGGAI